MIVVLTSRENFVWTSMQEIIPTLEDCWNALENVHIIDVDKSSLKGNIPYILKARFIVQTCFTTKIAILAEKIRTSLNPDAHFIIHLHSLATIGCWPMHNWKLGSVLRKSDIFVGTCERDKNCMDLCFKEHTTKIIPFCLKDLNQKIPSSNNKRLCYIGRLSAQKNLHLLLVSLKILKDEGLIIPLDLYGKADHLGSPNMEFYQDDYDQFLINLTDELDLNEQVTFHGFVKREDLYNSLDASHIFISPSLHSDENFGIAALRSLAMGSKAILSDWGGHADHKEHFPDQVELINVYHSSHGPFMNPFELAKMIKKTFLDDSKNDFELPDRFKAQNISDSFKKIISSNPEALEKIELSSFAKEILIQRESFVQKNLDKKYDREEFRRGCQIFHGYEDSIVHEFFKAYGAKPFIKNSKGSVFRLPWANGLNFLDIHKGEQSFKTEEELIASGFAFIVPKDLS